MTNWEQSSKLVLLQLHEKLPKQSASTIQQSLGIWSKLKRWKNSISGYLVSQPQIKKIIILKHHFLLCYEITTSCFLIVVWIVTWDEKWVLGYNQQWPAQWLDQGEAWKHFPKPKLNQNKGHGHWWPAASLSTNTFWVPGRPLHSEKHAQQMRCTENCSAHSWHWSTERAQFFSMTTPSVGTTNTSKVGRIGQSFAPSTISTWPLTNRLSLLQTSWQHFERKMLPQPGEDRKCYPRVHWILKHGFLCCRNKQTFLIDK